MDGCGTTAQAMAVKDGRVLALGKEQEMLNAHRGACVVDVKGPQCIRGSSTRTATCSGYALNLAHI